MGIASFDVDAQRCFSPLCPHELPVPGGDKIVDALNEQAKLASKRIGSKDAHPPNAIWVANEDNPPLTPLDNQHADCYWPTHAVPGEVGFELLPGLPHPSTYDYFIWKGIEPDMHPYGACYHDLTERLSTGVIEYLKTQAITQIIIGGLALDYCVKTTALQLKRAGFTVLINLEATRGLTAETTHSAKEALANSGCLLIEQTTDLPSYLT